MRMLQVAPWRNTVDMRRTIFVPADAIDVKARTLARCCIVKFNGAMVMGQLPTTIVSMNSLRW
jgi:hypothetical protein